MRILFLTYSGRPDNGYDVVGANVARGLVKDGGMEVDTYALAVNNPSITDRNCLGSISVLRFGWVATLHDVLLLLFKCRGREYDLIHCNVEHFAPVAMLLSTRWRVPYTVTVHGTYGVVLPRRKRMFKTSFERAAALICVSDYTAQRVQNEGINAHYKVIHNGVDTTVFSPGNPAKKENPITFIGNLKRRKGFPFLLEALLKARQDGAAFRLAVVGRIGNDEEGLINKGLKAGLDIELTGPVSTEELVGYYRRAKLNILPSFSEPEYFEGFGLVHLEANACGTLTVGTRDSGNAEAILSGNGYLVDYGDVETLAGIVTATMQEDSPERLMPAHSGLRDWKVDAGEYASMFRTLLISQA
ncbi:glycosyltransferase family 4 protein [Chlorobium phaeovibrioides]|uniref:Glycosyltransferase family 4 protein n=1 Tax=Chlorobium phaeovibrioides TaxID=1094 RepID=A0A432AVW4_CHLPH|nr:glycosyltransferase family 4 protein [Chlorobium phaeovibrioides]RTY38376.1 glycosyltransferase family 4 protein [Chlorobium phaeovibrioides]